MKKMYCLLPYIFLYATSSLSSAESYAKSHTFHLFTSLPNELQDKIWDNLRSWGKYSSIVTHPMGAQYTDYKWIKVVSASDKGPLVSWKLTAKVWQRSSPEEEAYKIMLLKNGDEVKTI